MNKFSYVKAVLEREKNNMRAGIIIIGVINTLMSAFLQVGLYERFKKKFFVFFVPLIHAIPIIFLFISEARNWDGVWPLFIIAFFFSIPAFIGSLLTGFIIVMVMTLTSKRNR